MPEMHERRAGPGRRLSRGLHLLALAGPAIAGAGLVVAVGLLTSALETGPSDADVRAAYTAGSAEGGEAGLAAVRAEREAAAAASAAPTAGGVEASRSSAAFQTWLAAQRAQGNDPAYEALGPTRLPVNAAANGRAVVCDASRCADVESGLSIHVITLQGWFDGNRAGRPAPVIVAGSGGNADPPTAGEVVLGGATAQGPTRIGDRLTCDGTRCTDSVTGASASVIRIQGWFNPSGLEARVGPRAAEPQAPETSSDAGSNFFGPGGGAWDGVGGDELARSLGYDSAAELYAPRPSIISGVSAATTARDGLAYGDYCGAPGCAEQAAASEAANPYARCTEPGCAWAAAESRALAGS